MRRNRSADCTGEPPGELTESATALRPLTAKARSSAAAWLANDKAVRHCRGPMTPSKRTTATLGGGWRKRSIGSSLRRSHGLILRPRWGLKRCGCRAEERSVFRRGPRVLAECAALFRPTEFSEAELQRQ